MNRNWLPPVLLLALDLGAMLLASFGSYSFWVWHNPQLNHVVQVRYGELFLPNPWTPPLLVLMAAWVFSNHLVGLYNSMHMEGAATIVSRLFRTTIQALLLLVVLQFLFAQRYYSRLLMLSFAGSTFAAMCLFRLGFHYIQRRFPRPLSLRSVAIFGAGTEALSMVERLQRYGSHAYRVVGFIVPATEPSLKVPPDEVLGGIDDLQALVNEHDLEVVVLATRHATRSEAFQLVRLGGRMGLRILQMPFTWGFASPRLGFASLGGLQLIDLQTLSYPSFAENLKRAFDVTAVLAGGLILLPLLTLVALLVRLESAGPALFVSPRVGKGGRHFPFFKFRSMVADANSLKDDLRAANESDGRLFKMQNDPRVTRVGRFIRKFSVDELPQLWNVLRGDMNLVGPRPLPAEDLRDIERDPEALYWFELRSKVKPGITGLWQVSGRSNLTFADMVALDVHYVQSWSIWLDIQILLKTVPAVLRGSGAS